MCSIVCVCSLQKITLYVIAVPANTPSGNTADCAMSSFVFNFFNYERGTRTLEKTEGRARQRSREEQTRRKEGDKSRLDRRRQGRR